MQFLFSRRKDNEKESDAITSLPEQLAITLQSLAPLPRSFAQAKRVDPLTHLEADLLAIAPFIQTYREMHARSLAGPESLSSFLAQTQLLKDTVEEQKYAGMTCRRTDLHESRDVVLRQLLRLFDAALEGTLKSQRAVASLPTVKVAKDSCTSRSASVCDRMSTANAEEARTWSKISAVLPFSPLSRGKANRPVSEGLLEVDLSSHKLEARREDAKRQAEHCLDSDVQEDSEAIVIRLQ